MSSKYLVNEYPLIVLPSLATLIGLNEAIILQQIHYWTSNPKIGIEADGCRWVRNTVDEWHDENFPFWSVKTIRRAIYRLEELGLVLTRSDLNQANYDKTKWYSVDYDAVNTYTIPSGQNDQWTGQNDQIDVDKMTRPIPDNTSDNTSEMIKGAQPGLPLSSWEQARRHFDGLGLMNGVTAAQAQSLVEDCEAQGRLDWVELACGVARENGAYNPKYAVEVLRSALKAGVAPGERKANGNGNGNNRSKGGSQAGFGFGLHRQSDEPYDSGWDDLPPAEAERLEAGFRAGRTA